MPTNTTIPSPTCLHIPALKRGSVADILWESNSGYELDWAISRESDEGVTTWRILEDNQTDWQSLENGEDTWLTLEGRADAQWQPLYRGRGELGESGDPDCPLEHILHSVEIPGDAITAQFRVRSYCGDQFSPYTLSEIQYLGVPTGPEISGSVSLSLTAGQEYQIQVNLRELPGFEDSILTLAYPADRLELLATTLDSGDFKTDSEEHTYTSQIEEVSREPGILRFRCTHDIPEEADLTALAACFRFLALTGGSAAVTLS